MSNATYWCRLYIAGNYTEACSVAGRMCRDIGWCVTVTPTTYVYSGGQEAGVIIEAIDYQRFPMTLLKTRERMQQLAEKLAVVLNQKSYSITDPFQSTYHKCEMPFE